MKRTIPLVFGMLLLVPALCSGETRRNAVRMGSDLTIEQGTTVHDAVAIGGNLVVNGAVEHDAVAVGGTVTLNAGASVGHNAVAVGGRVIASTGTRVGGDTVEVGVGRNSFSRDLRAVFMLLGILSLISFLALGLLVSAVFPKQVTAVSLVIEKEPGHALLWGVAGVLLIVPAALLLAVTVVGIMLIPLELVFVLVAFLVGYIAAAALVGRRAVAALRRSGWTLAGETLLGMALLIVAGWIPLVGWLVTTAALLAGFGAVLYALLRRRPEKTEETPLKNIVSL